MSSPAQYTVVIVEDNVTTNNLLQDWLKPHFSVVSFLDAETTLRDLDPTEEPIAFVVDFNLPGMNGLDLHREISPKFPAGKYILISGLFDEKLTREAKAEGYDALMPKPFSMPSIFRKIQELLGIVDAKESLVKKVKKGE